MANTLRFKRGLVAGIPNGALGEPLFTTDTFDLYIGNGTTNTRFQKYIASGTTSQLLRGDGSLLTMPIVLTSPSNGQVLKYDGTNWVNSSDAGVTGSGTAGQVTYWGSSSTITGSNNLFWDATNNRLGVKTNTPSYSLSVSGGMSLGNDGGIGILWQNSSAFRSSGTIFMDYGQGGSGDFQFRGGSSLVNVAILYNNGYINLAANGQRVGINQASPIVPLDVNGAMAVGGVLGAHQTDRLILEYNANKSAIRAYGNTSGSGILAFNTGGGGGTNDTERMRIHAGGNVAIGSTSDNGLRFQVTGDGYFSGSVGIGSTALTNRGLTIGRTMTGSTTGYGILQLNTIASDVTSSGINNYSLLATQAAAFTVTNAYNFFVADLSKGAGSTVTNQFGYYTANLTQGTNNYGFFGDIASGTGRWNLYMNGTAANYLNGSLSIGTTSTSQKVNIVGGVINTGGFVLNRSDSFGFFTGASDDLGIYHDGTNSFISNSTGALIFNNPSERMRLDASGNLGLGTASPLYTFHAVSTSSTIGAFRNSGAAIGQLLVGNTAGDLIMRILASGDGYILADTGKYLAFGSNGLERARIFSNGNVAIGTTTDAGFKLDVNGTMRVSGASTFGGNLNLPNTGEYYLQNAASTTFIGLNFDTPYIRFGVGGTVRAFMNATGLGLGTASPAYRLDVQGTLGVTGAATFSSSVTAGGNLLLTNGTASSIGAINLIRTGTSPVASRFTFGTDGTGYSFAIAKNQGGTITDLLTILDSGASTFLSSVRAAGFNSSGGNGYQVINSASNTVTALRSTSGGTSIMSSVSNGLHIAVGTEAAGDLILASNNTERVRLSSNGWFSHTSATNPSSSVTDSYVQYSADVTAGNAAPHFRTENGAVIKLYQETTGVGNAIFSQGGGNSVLDDSTFDGYTLRQIVKALRNQGILA